MKILYHHRIKSKDGQFVHIEELTKQLEVLGHDVRFVGPTSEHSADFGTDSATLNFARKILPRFLYEFIEFTYCLLDFVKLVRVIRQYRPDAIYERFNLFMPFAPLVNHAGQPLQLPYRDLPFHRQNDQMGPGTKYVSGDHL